MAAIGGIVLVIAYIALAVTGIVILIAGFKESVGQGLLCFFVPFYAIYYLFAKMEKGIWQKVFLGSIGVLVLGVILTVVGAGSAAGSMQDTMQDSLPSMESETPAQPAMDEEEESEE